MKNKRQMIHLVYKLLDNNELRRWFTQPHWAKFNNDLLAILGAIQSSWPLSLEEKKRYPVAQIAMYLETIGGNVGNADINQLSDRIYTLQGLVDFDGREILRGEVSDEEMQQVREMLKDRVFEAYPWHD